MGNVERVREISPVASLKESGLGLVRVGVGVKCLRLCLLPMGKNCNFHVSEYSSGDIEDITNSVLSAILQLQYCRIINRRGLNECEMNG